MRSVWAPLLALALTILVGACCATGLRLTHERWQVMSFNIRYGSANDGLNSWPLRKELLLDVLEDANVHILGVQEALAFQLDEIEARCQQYVRAGVARDDGKQAGEYSAILYHSGRLKLLAQDTFWLSETPAAVASATWGNQIPRICTWAEFESRASGARFHVFNTHLDHQSQSSRLESARLILRQIAAVAKEGPVLLMGDFNAGESNPAFMELVNNKQTVLYDSFRDLHPNEELVGTFNGFTGKTDGEKIDAVLVSEHWIVDSAEILRASKGQRYPSDHFPVRALLDLPGSR